MLRSILGAALAGLALLAAAPAAAATYDLVIDKQRVHVAATPSTSITVNGSVPGPVLRFREGEEVVIRVTNRMKERTSVHWHGLILPGDQDGVPGFNGYPGIAPGETFTYRFPIQQAGTYWYHAHSATQEQGGLYGALIIDPATPPKVAFDREHVVFLSDFTTEDPERILANLKVEPGYYNYHKRTLPDFFRDVDKFGWKKATADRRAWRAMNMDPTDIADTGGYTFLVNGRRPDLNETLLFKPGERVKLRVVNGSAMTYFDVRIPGLKLTVVGSDGADVEPVAVDEFRIAVAETYDVIVEPQDAAYTLFAESIDRTGYARATLAPRPGMSAPIPAMRPRAILTMADMGHGLATAAGYGTGPIPGTAAAPPADDPSCPAEHAAMGHCTPAAPAAPAAGDPACPAEHAAMGHCTPAPAAPAAEDPACPREHAEMGHCTPATPAAAAAPKTPFPKVDYGMGRAAAGDHAAMGHGAELAPEGETDGSGRVFGWASGAPHGARVLSYADLRAAEPAKDLRPPEREIVVRLGGNMERYIWTINGKRFEEAEPIALRYGERARLTFINESMMAHPMHLHGMFVRIENGQPMDRIPEKTVVSVAPGKTYSALITADQPGEWAFHCHLLYHMESGMMSKVTVAKLDAAAAHGAHR
jgi:CopA family copper-resistance protein